MFCTESCDHCTNATSSGRLLDMRRSSPFVQQKSLQMEQKRREQSQQQSQQQAHQRAPQQAHQQAHPQAQPQAQPQAHQQAFQRAPQQDQQFQQQEQSCSINCASQLGNNAEAKAPQMGICYVTDCPEGLSIDCNVPIPSTFDLDEYKKNMISSFAPSGNRNIGIALPQNENMPLTATSSFNYQCPGYDEASSNAANQSNQRKSQNPQSILKPPAFYPTIAMDCISSLNNQMHNLEYTRSCMAPTLGRSGHTPYPIPISYTNQQQMPTSYPIQSIGFMPMQFQPQPQPQHQPQPHQEPQQSGTIASAENQSFMRFDMPCLLTEYLPKQCGSGPASQPVFTIQFLTPLQPFSFSENLPTTAGPGAGSFIGAGVPTTTPMSSMGSNVLAPQAAAMPQRKPTHVLPAAAPKRSCLTQTNEAYNRSFPCRSEFENPNGNATGNGNLHGNGLMKHSCGNGWHCPHCSNYCWHPANCKSNDKYQRFS